MDVDLRRLRYFSVVAEEAHFGRAAVRLHITQPALSRQIRALEDQLGCALLTRTTRRVELTPAGHCLHHEGAELLAAAAAATRRVLITARGVQRIVVGFAPALTVSPAIRAFSSAHPDIEVEPLRLNWNEQTDAIRDGRIDIGYLRGTFATTPSIRTITIGSEPRVACLPRVHPLAARRQLSLADLDGQLMSDAQTRRTATVEDKFERVAADAGIVIVPESVAQFYPHPALTHRPIIDLPHDPRCLAIATGPVRPHITDFLTIAAEVLTAADAPLAEASISPSPHPSPEAAPDGVLVA